jgi:hypothetical protein
MESRTAQHHWRARHLHITNFALFGEATVTNFATKG